MIGKKAVLCLAGLATMAFLSVGCAGMQPFDLPNNREEGPEKGLLTGAQGEFVIYRSSEGTEKPAKPVAEEKTVDGKDATADP